MKHATRHLACVLMLGLVMPSAFACRPFGSYGFAEDARGGIWFTEGDNNAISRLDKDGRVVSYPLPTPSAEPSSVALAPNDTVWFAEMTGRKVGRVDARGRITEFPVRGGQPFQIAVDRRGQAWFTQMGGHDPEHGPGSGHGAHPAGIGRVDRAGKVHFHPAPEGWPTSIAFDRRGDTWVTLLVPGATNRQAAGRLARLDVKGRWRIAARWPDNSCPRNLNADPRGGMYFSDGCRETVGHRAADGILTEWKMPAGTRIQDMALGGDGRLWITDRKHLGHIDARGQLSLTERPENGDATMAVFVTREGDVLFSEFYNYNINRLTRSGEFVEHLVSVDERRGAREIRDGDSCSIRFAARIADKASMDARRIEEVRSGSFKPDGQGTEKLVEQQCLICHDARRLLLSRRSDWQPSILRMQAYREARQVPPLPAADRDRLVHYFNSHYGVAR